MRKINSKIGTIFTWYDFIKAKKTKNGVTYSQSNTKMEGYCQRYIGIKVHHNDDLYLAVAVSKNNDQGNGWKFIIENRIGKAIYSGGNIYPEDKGVTMVPISYKDLLFKDPYTYTSLYGLIDPTYLDLAVREATKANSKLIDNYVSNFRGKTS